MTLTDGAIFHSMILGGKNQYCENDYTTKLSLQIPIPIKLSVTFFTELE